MQNHTRSGVHTPTMYGYARVSTKGQQRYGNSLQDQHRLLQEAGVSTSNIFEDSYTGTKMDRPNFTALLAKLQPGDTLVVTKLDRFARTAADGATTIQDLITNRHVTVNILNMGVADNTPMGKLMITMLLAFAQFERDLIVQRTQSGKRQAKLSHPDTYKQGRPRITPPPLDKLQSLYDDLQAHKTTISTILTSLHISEGTWYLWVRQYNLKR